MRRITFNWLSQCLFSSQIWRANCFACSCDVLLDFFGPRTTAVRSREEVIDIQDPKTRKSANSPTRRRSHVFESLQEFLWTSNTAVRSKDEGTNFQECKSRRDNLGWLCANSRTRKSNRVFKCTTGTLLVKERHIQEQWDWRSRLLNEEQYP